MNFCRYYSLKLMYVGHLSSCLLLPFVTLSLAAPFSSVILVVFCSVKSRRQGNWQTKIKTKILKSETSRLLTHFLRAATSVQINHCLYPDSVPCRCQSYLPNLIMMIPYFISYCFCFMEDNYGNEGDFPSFFRCLILITETLG